MKKRNFAKLMAVAFAFSATAFSFHANADPKMVLKASDVHPMGYPTVEAIVRLGKKTRDSDQWPYLYPNVPFHAIGWRKGND